MNSSVTIRLPGLAISNEDGKVSEPPLASETLEAGVSDETLLAQNCEGNKEALATLFRRYAHIVRRVALRILKDPSEADDLLQDVFILIHRLCGTFDSSKTSAQFWILQMTYRRAISRRRYLNCRHFYAQVELDEGAIPAPDSGSAHSEGSVGQRLAELDLQKMFGSLSEDQQKTLRLHFIEGYTLDEIAATLGQTKRNIRNHSFRGLERLRKLIFAGKLPGARAV
ncbi:MAG: RNA polymerase sigma factor [Candidatus Sulfotelmatobacter sp.]